MKSSGKVILALCLTAVLLTGLALLPRATFRIADAWSEGVLQAAELQPPELELVPAEESSWDRAMRQLALERDMRTVPVSMDLAARTPEDIQGIVRRYITQYIEAFSAVSYYEGDFFLDLQLAIDPADYKNSMLIWTASYVETGKPYRSTFMHIDDQTGQLLYLNTDMLSREFYTENDYLDTLEEFAKQYFVGLGIPEYGNVSQKEAGLSEYSRWVRYTFDDEIHGTVAVEFFFAGSAITMHFLNSEDDLQQGTQTEYLYD